MSDSSQNPDSNVAATPPPEHVLLVGGMTGGDGDRRGLEAYRIDSSSGDEVRVSELAVLPLSSPSYLVAHPQQPVVYVVAETEPTTVSAVRIASDGSLELLNTVVSDGSGGCHLAVDETASAVVVAHYVSGTVSSFGISADGRLSEQLDHLALSGSGPHPERQQSPHPHQVVPHQGRLLVPDLGSDQIHQLRLSPEGYLSMAEDPVRLPAGSGPRHLVATANHLVVVCELSARLWLARREEGRWVAAHDIACSGELAPPQPEDEVPQGAEQTGCLPSAIRLDGDQVLVANRGPDTVAVVELDVEQHRLVPRSELPSGGRWPRDLLLSETHLWLAHVDSDAVVALRRDGEGDWRVDFELPCPAPGCVLLLDTP